MIRANRGLTISAVRSPGRFRRLSILLQRFVTVIGIFLTALHSFVRPHRERRRSTVSRISIVLSNQLANVFFVDGRWSRGSYRDPITSAGRDWALSPCCMEDRSGLVTAFGAVWHRRAALSIGGQRSKDSRWRGQRGCKKFSHSVMNFLSLRRSSIVMTERAAFGHCSTVQQRTSRRRIHWLTILQS